MSFAQRIACYIQVFALSRWLAVTLPIEYYEFARGLQWSIPYFSLPWESGGIHPIMWGTNSSTAQRSYISDIHDSEISQSVQLDEENVNIAAPVYGLPLTPMEYRSFFEVSMPSLMTCSQLQIAVVIIYMIESIIFCRARILIQKQNTFLIHSIQMGQ